MVRTYVIAGRGALLLVSTHDARLAETLPAALGSPDPLEAVIEQLTRTGLRAVPSFAYVVEEPSSVRVVLRGDATAAFVARGKSEVATANQATTWAEHLIDAPESLTLLLGDTEVIVALEGLVKSAVTPDAPVTGARIPERAGGQPPEASPVAASPARLERASAAQDAEEAARCSVTPSPEAETLIAAEVPPEVDPSGSPPAVAAQSGSEDEFDFSHMLEETRFRDVEAAAVREGEKEGATANPDAPVIDCDPPLDLPAPPSNDDEPPTSRLLIDAVPVAREGGGRPGSPAAGDHDGMTVGVSELRAARAAIAEARPMVQAVTCPAGHFNPPHADACRTCRTRITQRDVEVIVRPALGLLRFADGLVAELDRPLLIGRRPHGSSEGFNGEHPNLITIPDPDKALSRTHLAVSLQEWEVFVSDLESVNHSFAQLPGQPPVQLRPREPFLIVPGATVTLGDVTSFAYEVTVS